MNARSCAASLLLCLPVLASAGTISGRITAASDGSPLAGLEVRAWVQTPKGYVIQSPGGTTLSAADGTYTLTVAGGSYKVDARMPAFYSGNYGDRWFDVAAPTGGGYVPEDADVLVLADAGTLSGVDIALELLGGFDGQVVNGGGSTLPGMLVRAELKSDPRIHHNDVTTFHGLYYGYGMRGLPPGDYRLLVHDPSGQFEDTVVAGPVTVVANGVGVAPSAVMVPVVADPNEPNNLPADTRSAIDSPTNPFRQSPPLPYQSTGALIGPSGAGDVDHYCWDALATDRYIVKAYATLSVEGATRDNPWVDPVVAFGRVEAGVFSKLAEDDDSLGSSASPGSPGSGARLDAEILPASTPGWGDGRYCVIVSTFGDSAFNGTGQNSVGRYTVEVAMGNRRPTLTNVAASVAGGAPAPVPAPPTAVSVDEGQSLAVTFDYADPDGDTLSTVGTLKDRNGATVAVGTFTASAGHGSFAWDVAFPDAALSPYVLTLSVADAEFTTSIDVDVVVVHVNRPPSTPTLVSPADGATSTSYVTDLTIGNSTDPDGDALSYEFELYFGSTAGAPDLVSGTVVPGTGNTTFSANLPTSTEDVHVSWRARANDGQTVSTWTSFAQFLVNTRNDPPLAADILKPDEGATVTVRRPALQSTNPADPEGDAIQLHFEVATDVAFTNLVATSPAIDANGLAGATTWTVTQDLAWGTQYFARAHATDTSGAAGPTGVIHGFTLAPNQLPPAPSLAGPLGASCSGYTASTAPSSFDVSSDPDPQGDAVTLELAVFAAGADPGTATPLASGSAARAGATTAIPVSASTFVAGTSYQVSVRANDGTDRTAWSTCKLSIAAPPPQPAPSSGGCGCSTPGSGLGLEGVLALLALLGLRRRGPARLARGT